ncbi:hypothetical protein, partial [Thiolapillus sp.]|uniref:hypothetical protein n=1 Tax=Thiolapillus sp. TaxID=2017437 RepID=UPI003AF88366
PLALCARRVSSAASRLLGSTSLRFALHGWQRRICRNSRFRSALSDTSEFGKKSSSPSPACPAVTVFPNAMTAPKMDSANTFGEKAPRAVPTVSDLYNMCSLLHGDKNEMTCCLAKISIKHFSGNRLH